MFSGRLPFSILSLSFVILVAGAEETLLGKVAQNNLIRNEGVLTPCSVNSVKFLPYRVAKALGAIRVTRECECDNVYAKCSSSSDHKIQFSSSGSWNSKGLGWNIAQVVHVDQNEVIPSDLNGLSRPRYRRAIFARDDDGDGHEWNTVQLVTPVIVGVAVAAIMLTLFMFYRRGSLSFAAIKAVPRRIGEFFARMSRNWFGMRKVRTGKRDERWDISGENLELAPSPRSDSHSSGHVRLSSRSEVSDHLEFPSDPPRKPTIWVMPGKNLWKNSTLVQKTRRLMLMIPLPWKNAIAPVRSTAPHRKFEIDSSNKSTRTNSTLANFRRGGFRTSGSQTVTTESSGPSHYSRFAHTDIHEAIEEEDEGSDMSSDLGLGTRTYDALAQFEDDDDTEQLISPETANFDPEQDVMVIGDRDFTLESGDTIRSSNRVLPSSYGGSVATHSPVEQLSSRQPVPPVPSLPLPAPTASRSPPAPQHTALPPAPKYPAPVPPATSPRSTPRSPPRQLREPPSIERIVQQPPARTVDYSSIPPPPPPPQRVFSPPQPILSPPPVFSPPPVVSPPPPPPSQLPLPDIEPPTPLYTRRPSESTPNLLSPYEADGRLLPQRSMESIANRSLHTLHERSESSTSSLTIPQMSSPPYRSSPLPQEIRIARSDSPPPPMTPPAGALLFSSSPSYGGRPLPHPSASPQMQHRRLLSAEAPGNTFYSLAEHSQNGTGSDAYPTPQSHTRNLSSESIAMQQHSQAMLFPGPVRAAGYMHERNMSSDSISRRGYEARNEESFIA